MDPSSKASFCSIETDETLLLLTSDAASGFRGIKRGLGGLLGTSDFLLDTGRLFGGGGFLGLSTECPAYDLAADICCKKYK